MTAAVEQLQVHAGDDANSSAWYYHTTHASGVADGHQWYFSATGEAWSFNIALRDDEAVVSVGARVQGFCARGCATPGDCTQDWRTRSLTAKEAADIIHTCIDDFRAGKLGYTSQLDFRSPLGWWLDGRA